MTMAIRLPVHARAAPRSTRGPLDWIRRNLFNSLLGGAVTIVLLGILCLILKSIVEWGLIHAVFMPSASECQAARGSGACWGVITEKYRLILMGRYPFGEHWRPVVSTAAVVSLLIVSCMPRAWSAWLGLAWIGVLAAGFVLMHGGWFGLEVVTTDLWGGLPLTIMLSTCGIGLAYPLSIAVALGRRSKLPAIHSLCLAYIELVRGVPLISVLFMASFMFPLFLPVGMSPDVLLRVLTGITLFSAAYLAEVVRGGLQAIPAGQIEAAATLGLSYWQMQRKIVLPQALAMVVPGIMNSFISILKDTSLVTIVSLYELTGSLGLALNSDVNWRPFKLEAYLFISAIYFALCFAMSRYSLWIERQSNRSRAR
jgi:general L-amino acid transport system permease protein